MTVSTETVRMVKSRPRKNQSERSDLPCHIINYTYYMLSSQQLMNLQVYRSFLFESDAIFETEGQVQANCSESLHSSYPEYYYGGGNRNMIQLEICSVSLGFTPGRQCSLKSPVRGPRFILTDLPPEQHYFLNNAEKPGTARHPENTTNADKSRYYTKFFLHRSKLCSSRQNHKRIARVHLDGAFLFNVIAKKRFSRVTHFCCQSHIAE